MKKLTKMDFADVGRFNGQFGKVGFRSIFIESGFENCSLEMFVILNLQDAKDICPC